MAKPTNQTDVPNPTNQTDVPDARPMMIGDRCVSSRAILMCPTPIFGVSSRAMSCPVNRY